MNSVEEEEQIVDAIDDDTSELERLLLERRNICLSQNSSISDESSGILTCPRTFDGWSCWNETKAGFTAYAPCPDFIIGFDPQRLAHKTCEKDGFWFRHPESNATWSNYTTCIDISDLKWRQIVINIYEVGYFVSICALVISLIIFCSFRVLACARVTIHKHLFVSFIISNVFWLIWYRVIVKDPDIPANQDNWIWCGTLHVFVQYFLVANYFWMFVEGFYLHTLIVFAFTRHESTLLKGFAIFGWLGPLIPVSLYAGFRASNEEESRACGLETSKWSIFLEVPVCLCLILSLAFLVNILRVLLTKLKQNRRPESSSSALPSEQSSLRKAVRATLILIPLLGLNYLLTPFRPEPGSQWEIVYEYVSSSTSSFQGLCVSILFCFSNSEVLLVIKRRFFSKNCQGKFCHRGEYSQAPTSTIMASPEVLNGNGKNHYSEACL